MVCWIRSTPQYVAYHVLRCREVVVEREIARCSCLGTRCYILSRNLHVICSWHSCCSDAIGHSLSLLVIYAACLAPI